MNASPKHTVVHTDSFAKWEKVMPTSVSWALSCFKFLQLLSVCYQWHYQNKHCNYFFVSKNNDNKDISVLLKAELPVFPVGMMSDRKWGNSNTETEEIKKLFSIKDGVLEWGRFKWREFNPSRAATLPAHFLLFVLQPSNECHASFKRKGGYLWENMSWEWYVCWVLKT